MLAAAEELVRRMEQGAACLQETQHRDEGSSDRQAFAVPMDPEIRGPWRSPPIHDRGHAPESIAGDHPGPGDAAKGEAPDGQ